MFSTLFYFVKERLETQGNFKSGKRIPVFFFSYVDKMSISKLVCFQQGNSSDTVGRRERKPNTHFSRYRTSLLEAHATLHAIQGLQNRTDCKFSQLFEFNLLLLNQNSVNIHDIPGKIYKKARIPATK